jgi:hypothetical protein
MIELLILQSKTRLPADAISTKKSGFFWPEILLSGVADGVVAAACSACPPWRAKAFGVLSGKQRDR